MHLWFFFLFFLSNDTPIAEKACEMVEMGGVLMIVCLKMVLWLLLSLMWWFMVLRKYIHLAL